MSNQFDLGYWQGYAQQMQSQRDHLRQQVAKHKRARGKAWDALNTFRAKLARHDDHKVRSCVRKRRYRSREEAQCYAQINHAECPMVVYPCQYCEGHHLATDHVKLKAGE